MSNDDSTTAPEGTSTNSYEKGTWQEALQRSTNLLDRSTKARKQASTLLWSGAQTAIEEWLPTSSTDVSGENLYSEVLDILGKPRKGDASKIKAVAIAVKDHGLHLSMYPNLSKAYAEASRLTKTVQQEADEDDAADKAVAALAESVPNSTTTVEGAALILLSKGIDGAVVAILDALGANNEAAHRSFMRAVSTEIAARVQAAKPKPVKAGPKAGATQATGQTSTPKATVADGKTKAKPATKGATKAKPVATSATKGDPNKRILPGTKAKPVAAEQAEPVKGEPVAEPVHVGTDTGEVAEAPVAKKAARRAVPVRRPAAKATA